MKNDAPKTLREFLARFRTEEACEDYLARWRWPRGFVCPHCKSKGAWRIARRRLYQCRTCRVQVSVTAGTAMHKSKLPLTTWFWAMFLVGRHKKGISALQLQADLGLGSYESAWLLMHKIRACFSESADYPLKGIVEVDETLVGAKQKGDPPGKDPGHKAIVVAAVERRRRGGLGSLRLQQVPAYTSEALAGFVVDTVAPSARLHTDGWAAYDVLERQGYSDLVLTAWRAPLIGVGAFSLHTDQSTDRTVWSDCIGTQGVDPGSNLEGLYAWELTMQWFRLRVVLLGTDPGVTCWAQGYLIKRERGPTP